MKRRPLWPWERAALMRAPASLWISTTTGWTMTYADGSSFRIVPR